MLRTYARAIVRRAMRARSSKVTPLRRAVYPEKNVQDSVVVISIRPHRLRDFQTALPVMASVATVVGVNGHTVDQDRMKREGRLARDLKPGVVGCFLSHRKAWKSIYESNRDTGLVFEDDARWVTSGNNTPKTTVLAALKYLRTQKKDWHVLLLGRNPRRRVDLERVNDDVVKTGSFWGLYAYAVSKKGAELLLKHTQLITKPCDTMVSDLGMTGKLNVYALVEDAFTYHMAYRSDTFCLK